MKIAIMQPTYLPWMGYFSLIDQVDKFVILDNVQFEHQSWQHKNKINSKNGEVWLTVPVFTKGRFGQKIHEVQIDSKSKWTKKHFSSIKFNYIKSKYFKDHISFFQDIFSLKWDSLLELNMEIINYIVKELGMKAEIIFASSLSSSLGKSERIVSICQELNCETYISPLGSFDYLDKENIFEEKGIQLLYHNFEHPEYFQRYGDFIPFLSVIDALFNVGEKTYELIENAKKRLLTHEEFKKVYSV